jgi:hypothetical protein
MADSITFRFSGGEEYSLDLRRWRDRLRGEVHQAAKLAAQRTATYTVSHYHEGRTGKLRGGVRVKDEAPQGDVVKVIVRTLAPHSHLYEKGTKERRTAQGWKRGRMKPSPTFIPIVIQQRAGLMQVIQQVMSSPEPALGEGRPDLTGSL